MCLLLVVLSCGHGASLSGDWGIPARESGHTPLSREFVLVADNQAHHLYGDPVWLRSGFTNRFVSVAIRAVQLDFFGPDLLRWILEYASLPTLHLGDALNVACSAEWEAFVRVMNQSGKGWVLAPGNHDAFYFGNGDFAHGEWTRACRTADGRGVPFTKDRLVRAYLLALSDQARRSVPGFAFELRAPFPNEGEWTAPDGADALVTHVAWHIDQEHPWRSFVVQRLDLGVPEQEGSPVIAVLVDTSQYTLRPGLLPLPPWRNSGVTGSLRQDQIDVVDGWLSEDSPDTVHFVMGHHPYASLTRSSRAAVDRWRRHGQMELYISAHTHTAQYFVHPEGDGESWLELNVGSTTDWPPEFRTLAVYEDGELEERVGLRIQRFLVHRVWDDEGSFYCQPEWEVPPERVDFYASYAQLITPDPAVTQAALLDTLLRTHAWLLHFIESADDNAAWPPGTTNDTEVQEQISARLCSGSAGEKLSLLRSLRRFEEERMVANPDLRRVFRLCQAKWASRVDLEGRRHPDPEDEYILLPEE